MLCFLSSATNENIIIWFRRGGATRWCIQKLNLKWWREKKDGNMVFMFISEMFQSPHHFTQIWCFNCCYSSFLQYKICHILHARHQLLALSVPLCHIYFFINFSISAKHTHSLRFSWANWKRIFFIPQHLASLQKTLCPLRLPEVPAWLWVLLFHYIPSDSCRSTSSSMRL